MGGRAGSAARSVWPLVQHRPGRALNPTWATSWGSRSQRSQRVSCQPEPSKKGAGEEEEAVPTCQHPPLAGRQCPTQDPGPNGQHIPGEGHMWGTPAGRLRAPAPASPAKGLFVSRARLGAVSRWGSWKSQAHAPSEQSPIHSPPAGPAAFPAGRKSQLRRSRGWGSRPATSPAPPHPPEDAANTGGLDLCPQVALGESWPMERPHDGPGHTRGASGTQGRHQPLLPLPCRGPAGAAGRTGSLSPESGDLESSGPGCSTRG